MSGLCHHRCRCGSSCRCSRSERPQCFRVIRLRSPGSCFSGRAIDQGFQSRSGRNQPPTRPGRPKFTLGCVADLAFPHRPGEPGISVKIANLGKPQASFPALSAPCHSRPSVPPAKFTNGCIFVHRNGSFLPSPRGVEDLIGNAECLSPNKVESESHLSGQRRDSIGIEIAPLLKAFAGKRGKVFLFLSKSWRTIRQ